MEEDKNSTEGINTFSNDGSFMDRFKKMQEENKPETPTTTTAATRPIPALRPALHKPLSTKVYAKKKNPFLVKPVKKKVTERVSVKKEGEGVSVKKEGEGVSVKKEGEGVSVKKEGEGVSVKEGEGEEQRDTKKESIPLASSIGLGCGVQNDSSDQAAQPQSSLTSLLAGKKRKRSRWSDAPPTATPPSHPPSSGTDDSAITVAMASFGESPATSAGGGSGQQLTPAQLIQIQEQIEMNKMVAEIRAVTESAKVKPKKKKNPDQVQYEYDSDEDTEGGTWEHKKRTQEMLATYEKAVELTERSKGKHHIGDFLPPEEMERFLEKIQAIKDGRNPDFSDYKDHKLTDSNIGFRLLQKAGWAEGEGLGEIGKGITDPINKGKTSFDQAGVGVEVPGELTKDDDAFDTYRKRMMLAYRFRPNPLNNPRRPYY